MSDEELMKQIKSGNSDALDILVRRYHGLIHAYIVRMGLEHHLASDLVQEVFIKLIRHIETYQSSRPFRPWLYAIASNTYKDYFKKSYVQKDLLTANLPDNLTGPKNPEDIFLIQESRSCVISALARLNEIQREVIVLRYYQDLKLDEISLVLKIPLGTVKSRLSNALKHLKSVLAKGVTHNDGKVS